MRLKIETLFVPLFLFASFALFACSSGGEDPGPCEGVICDSPPADACKDADSLLVYDGTGTCDEETGLCSYAATDEECDHGCADDACAADPCAEIVCDDPPTQACHDADNLRVWTDGNCVDGDCVYDQYADTFCENGCADDACVGDPCAGIVCDEPPAPACHDETYLRTWTDGSCVDGDCVYEQYSDSFCDYGCTNDACNPLPEGALELVIPENTGLCTIWGWGGDSVRMNWEGKARVTLNPGRIVFLEGEDEIEADLIAGLEVWPGFSATAKAPGTFLRSIEEDEEGVITWQRFLYSQDFAADARTMRIELMVEYAIEDGVASQPTVVLDDPTLFEQAHYTGVFLEEWMQIQLISCNFDYLIEEVRSIEVDNGDTFSFTKRGIMDPANGAPFELVKTLMVRDGETREVTDFFDLCSSLNHHGWFCGYLAHFDEPVGDVHLIWIDEFSYGDVVHYMNGDGQEIESSPFTRLP
ncbi:MAG: hypothetical protein JRF33_06250 [Deltaproteobacteria bacterium]|nr:hypothetical protein [Deltaproteobacteria bacterium]